MIIIGKKIRFKLMGKLASLSLYIDYIRPPKGTFLQKMPILPKNISMYYMYISPSILLTY